MALVTHFFFLQFSPGDSGSWIHTIELRIIVMLHCHARLSHCHGAGERVIATLSDFHNLFLVILAVQFIHSNLGSLGNCYTCCTNAVINGIATLFSLCNLLLVPPAVGFIPSNLGSLLNWSLCCAWLPHCHVTVLVNVKWQHFIISTIFSWGLW